MRGILSALIISLSALFTPKNAAYAKEAWVCAGIYPGIETPMLRHFVLDGIKLYDKRDEDFLRNMYSIPGKEKCDSACVNKYTQSSLHYYAVVKNNSELLLAVDLGYVIEENGTIKSDRPGRTFVSLFIDKARRAYSQNSWSPFPAANGQPASHTEFGDCTLVE